MRKALLKVALSSILALSLSSANSLVDILNDSQDSKVDSLAQYQNDNNLYFKDAYGFTLYDYAYNKANQDVQDWLALKNIETGVDSAIVQRAQIWLYILNYPVDNLEGNFTPAFQEDILNYQKKNNLALVPIITPEWFIDLEHDAITALLKDIEKEHPSLSEAQLQLALITNIQELLPASVDLGLLTNGDYLLNVNNQKVLFEITPPNATQKPYEMLIDLDFLKNLEAEASVQELSETLLTYFTFTPEEIKKLTDNPRSAKTLTLQTWLRMAGYFPPPLVIDGINGANSRNANKSFQTSLGQKADGIPHSRWEEPLETIIREKVQKQLQILEFYSQNINGRNDAATRNAISRFEESVGLPKTGTLVPSMLFHLFNPHFLPKEKIREVMEVKLAQPTSSAKEDAQNVPEIMETSETEEIILDAENVTNADNADNIEDYQDTDIDEIEMDNELDTSIPHPIILIQNTLTILAEQQKIAEAEQKKADEIAAKEAEIAQKKIELAEMLQKLSELNEPMQYFSLSRAEVDELLIKAKRSDIFFAQTAMYLLKLYDGDLDGANGPATRDAIRKLEKALGQRETGEVLPRWQTPLRQIMYRMVQYRLAQDNLYDGEVDGVSGPDTRNAIMAYEKAMHTEEVGQLTPALLLTLFNNDLNGEFIPPVDPKDIPTDSVEDVTIDETAPVSAEEDSSLQADNKKNEEQYRASVKGLDLSHAKSTEKIALVQLQLAYLGFYTGTVDGLTGPGTTRAITAFQQAFKLPTSGKLDKRTEEMLEKEDVNKFQRYLNRTGYMKDAETGTMGPKTRRAVGILKNRYGYQVNEALDIPAYLILIDEEQGTTLAKEYHDKVIKAREAEQRLVDTQSYLIGFGILKGKADGKMGPATERAITTYRSQNKLAKGTEIDNALLESFKKNAPKQAQTYLQGLGYPVKPDGIFGNNSKKQLNAFLKSQRKGSSDVVTATILMDLKLALDAKSSNRSSGSSNTATSQGSRKTGVAPRLQRGLQQDGILSAAPKGTVNGSLQIVKNNSGKVVGCKVNNITMAADWCSGKRNGSSCRVLYRNGRVLSMNCK